jgi:hypothetical protein
MKRFYASCGALVVGIVLVGPVHAGPRQPSQRAGHRSQHYSGHHRRALRPWLLQVPWRWLPDQSQGPVDYDTGPGGYDPNAGGSQAGMDFGGGSVAPPAATPKGGSQRGTVDPGSGTDDPNAGGGNPNAGDSQAGMDLGGGSVAPPAVTSKGSSQRRLKFGTGPRRMSGPGAGRR